MVTPLQKKSYNRRHTFTVMAGEGLGGASPSDSPPSALGEVARPERRGMGGSGGGGGGGGGDPLVLQLDYLNAVANEEREEGEGGGDAGSSPGVVEVSSASVCKGKVGIIIVAVGQAACPVQANPAWGRSVRSRCWYAGHAGRLPEIWCLCCDDVCHSITMSTLAAAYL